MQAFIRYAKQPHVMEDIKGTFECSAKFKYPKPSETQVRKYFDDEMGSIISRFYVYLKNAKNLVENPDKEFEENNKSIDQSDIIVEFDSWLEKDYNEFTYVEKEKEKPKPLLSFTPHVSQSATFAIQPGYSNSLIQNSNSKFIPAAFREPPRPTPDLKPQPQPTHAFVVEKQSPAIKSLVQPMPYPMQHYQPIRPQVIPHERGEEKPYRTRFIEKMAEYLENPERMNIIKYEATALINRK